MMDRRVMLALACLAMLGVSLRAEEPQEAPAKPELKVVQVINGATFTATENLSDEYKLVAETLGFEKATFQRDGGTLRIGVQLADAAPGQILLVKQNSDCPDNSIYRVQSIPAVAARYEKTIRHALTEWTKYRHDDAHAKLRKIVVTNVANKARNFDVRLDLSKVASIPRE